jgi:uncharacterized membrane protein YkvA (DUF1232 family)
MATAEQKVAVLQGFVDRFATDLITVRDAAADATTPQAAQRFLIGGMNYALDMLDIFPDHYKGLGIADDALVLRLAAKLAIGAGATHAALKSLADEASEVTTIFGELAKPLEQLVAQFPDREVRGRTAAKILSHKDTRVMFDADIGREAKRHAPQQIDTRVEGAERAIIELRKMIEHAIKKAGISA